ncbi:conjugal transfer protein [Actinacidiphila oryziradicis]|uniref:conjugal transfer protein n=1 Tax=Actinacidiphila oryziradicis TaxID=2571141 RepID=UPI001B80DA94|nr:conjugal transfer protein [Actinacidiphila oryziradicis]
MNRTDAQLTRGQAWILATATLPMIATGALGGWGTYTNIVTKFGRAATALGVVAAGEGVTLVLALVMVGLTMLGQSAPAPVRVGLWCAPLAASLIGVSVASNLTESVVYALTPMAMCASAEGISLIARRIVVYRTGVDMEAQRRHAATVQQLAYHRARAANHPNEGARRRSELRSWRLARKVGVGDAELGASLVRVQRERLREGADAALAGMFGVGAAPESLELPPAEEPEPVTELVAEVVDFDPLPVLGMTTSATTHGLGYMALADLGLKAIQWPPPASEVTTEARDRVTTAAASETARQTVTAVVVKTPAELRKQARKLNAQTVAETGRQVTIEALRSELGLSRRDAGTLRREILEGGRS